MFRMHYPETLELVLTNAVRWRQLGAADVDWLSMAVHHRKTSLSSLGCAFAAEYDSLGFIARLVWS